MEYPGYYMSYADRILYDLRDLSDRKRDSPLSPTDRMILKVRERLGGIVMSDALRALFEKEPLAEKSFEELDLFSMPEFLSALSSSEIVTLYENATDRLQIINFVNSIPEAQQIFERARREARLR